MRLFIPFLLLNTFVVCFSDMIQQLSFSGGGAFGAVEIGILERLQLNDKRQNFDYYTGISAGGINAGYLSHFDNLNEGILSAKKFYKRIRNKDIYKLNRTNHLSLFDTTPLRNTINSIISKLNKPKRDAYIGTTNLYTGELDVYNYKSEYGIYNKTDLLMSTSAIPVVFPPIMFHDYQYADGGTLQNELLLNIVNPENSYLNITFITPFNDNINDDTELVTWRDVAKRSLIIIKNHYNNEMTKINTNCNEYNGEVNKYYVDSSLLSDYNMLNFNKGSDLLKIGYDNVIHERQYFC